MGLLNTFLVRARLPLCDGHVRPLVVLRVVPHGERVAVAAAAFPELSRPVVVAAVGPPAHGPAGTVQGGSTELNYGS